MTVKIFVNKRNHTMKKGTAKGIILRNKSRIV